MYRETLQNILVCLVIFIISAFVFLSELQCIYIWFILLIVYLIPSIGSVHELSVNDNSPHQLSELSLMKSSRASTKYFLKYFYFTRPKETKAMETSTVCLFMISLGYVHRIWGGGTCVCVYACFCMCAASLVYVLCVCAWKAVSCYLAHLSADRPFQGQLFRRAYRGMIQKIIASINKLKMKQRGVLGYWLSHVQWQLWHLIVSLSLYLEPTAI